MRRPDVSARRAQVAASSIDTENRTFEAVIATGARVRVFVPSLGRAITESLVVSRDAVDTSLVERGLAPLLNTHDEDDVRSVLGRVLSVRLDEGRIVAVMQVSRASDVDVVWQRILDGTLRYVSVGYVVAQRERVADDGPEYYRATSWQIQEVSLVARPADANAVIRASDLEESEARPQECGSDETGGVQPEEKEVSAMDADENGSAADADHEETAGDDVARGAADDAVQAERKAERARIREIHGIAATVRGWIDEATVRRMCDEAIDGGMTADQFRAAVLDEKAERGRKKPKPSMGHISQGVSYEDPAVVREAMADAIVARAMPSARDGKSGPWLKYVALGPKDMLLELAAVRGERATRADMNDLIKRAFHHSSDFPQLLENAGNKMLLAGYQTATPSYRRIFAQRNFNDFKAHSFLGVGDFPNLLETNESGEILAGTMSEKRERVTARTYSRQLRITRQMLINDDLGAFSDFGTMIGRRVAEFENTTAYLLLNSAGGDGPTLAEGSAAVFGTARGNKAAAGAAISETTLDAAYAAMMGFTSLDSVRLNVTPRFLLTGSAYRGAAIRFTRALPNVATAANVALYDDLEAVADANVTGNRWYLFADPASVPVYIWGYVNGQVGPMVRTHQYVPGTDGIAVEVVHDFAVGAVDWRGGFFNPGA